MHLLITILAWLVFLAGIALLAWAVLGFLGNARGPDPMGTAMTFHLEWLRGALVVCAGVVLLHWLSWLQSFVQLFCLWILMLIAQRLLRRTAR
jgi:hypothetical protein